MKLLSWARVIHNCCARQFIKKESRQLSSRSKCYRLRKWKLSAKLYRSLTSVCSCLQVNVCMGTKAAWPLCCRINIKSYTESWLLQVIKKEYCTDHTRVARVLRCMVALLQDDYLNQKSISHSKISNNTPISHPLNLLWDLKYEKI